MMDNTSEADAARPVPAQCRMCARRDGLPCAYIDGHGRSCATDWCSDHAGSIGGLRYCRRHLGIVSVLGTSATAGHLPDVDNRAHSLANWVGNDLDGGMRNLLDHAHRPGGAETVVAEPIRYIFTVYRTHLWERSWKLVGASAEVLKVSVDVDEASDAEVRLRIGKRTIMSMVPPWIERRYAAPGFTSDVQARREYYAMLLSAAQAAIDQQRNG